MIFNEKDIESLIKTKDVVMKDICAIADKGTILPTDWDNLDKAVNILHHIAETNANIDKSYDSEMSGRRYDIRMDSWDQMPSGSYPDMRGSYERGRSATTGRYISRDSETKMRLESLMPTLTDPMERQALQRVMERT